MVVFTEKIVENSDSPERKALTLASEIRFRFCMISVCVCEEWYHKLNFFHSVYVILWIYIY